MKVIDFASLRSFCAVVDYSPYTFIFLIVII